MNLVVMLLDALKIIRKRPWYYMISEIRIMEKEQTIEISKDGEMSSRAMGDKSIVINLSDECSIEEEVQLLMLSQKKVEPKSRSEITWKRKVEILTEIEKMCKLPGKMSHREMAAYFSIPRNTLFNILRARNRIIEAYKRNSSGRRKRLRSCKAPHVENALFKWYRIAKKQKLPLSNMILFEKARDLAVSQGSYNFHPSTGWLERWKKRHNITFSPEISNVSHTNEKNEERAESNISSVEDEDKMSDIDLQYEQDDDGDEDESFSPTAHDISRLLQISLEETEDIVHRGKGIKRQTLTLRQKFDIVKAVESLPVKWSLRDMASFFDVPKTTMLHMMKNRDVIVKNYLNSPDKERRRNKKGKAPDIEDALYLWYLKVKKKNLPITAGILRKKAKSIALSVGKPDFVPTEGWFARWKKRNNVTCGRHKQSNGTEKANVHLSEYDEGDIQLFNTAYEKEKRTSLSLRQKVEVIHQMESDPKVKLREWVDLYNVSKSTLSIIKKNKETILKSFYGDPSADRKRMKKGSASEIEEALFMWYRGVKDQNTELNSTVLRDKAKELANCMGKVDFIPTSTWLDTWKRKHGLLDQQKQSNQQLSMLETHLNQIGIPPLPEDKEEIRFQFHQEHQNGTSGRPMNAMEDQNHPPNGTVLKVPANLQPINNYSYPRDNMFGFHIPSQSQENVGIFDGFLRSQTHLNEAVIENSNIAPQGVLPGISSSQQLPTQSAPNKFMGSHIYGSELSNERDIFSGDGMNRAVIANPSDHSGMPTSAITQGDYTSSERLLQPYKVDNRHSSDVPPATELLSEGSVRRAMMEIRRFLEQSPCPVDWSVVHSFEMLVHANIAASRSICPP